MEELREEEEAFKLGVMGADDEEVVEGDTTAANEPGGEDFTGVPTKERLPARYILFRSPSSSSSSSSLSSCVSRLATSSSSSSPDIIDGTVARKEFLTSELLTSEVLTSGQLLYVLLFSFPLFELRRLEEDDEVLSKSALVVLCDDTDALYAGVLCADDDVLCLLYCTDGEGGER